MTFEEHEETAAEVATSINDTFILNNLVHLFAGIFGGILEAEIVTKDKAFTDRAIITVKNFTSETLIYGLAITKGLDVSNIREIADQYEIVIVDE